MSGFYDTSQVLDWRRCRSNYDRKQKTRLSCSWFLSSCMIGPSSRYSTEQTACLVLENGFRPHPWTSKGRELLNADASRPTRSHRERRAGRPPRIVHAHHAEQKGLLNVMACLIVVDQYLPGCQNLSRRFWPQAFVGLADHYIHLYTMPYARKLSTPWPLRPGSIYSSQACYWRISNPLRVVR